MTSRKATLSRAIPWRRFPDKRLIKFVSPQKIRGGDRVAVPFPMGTAPRPWGATAQQGGFWQNFPQLSGAAAEREACPFDDHPESPAHTIVCGMALSLFPRMKAHPVQAPVTRRTGCRNSRFRPNFPPWGKFRPPAVSFPPPRRRLFFVKTKKSGGRIPPQPSVAPSDTSEWWLFFPV